MAQQKPLTGKHKGGRNSVFEDYRLRVASVIRDYGMFERQEALRIISFEITVKNKNDYVSN